MCGCIEGLRAKAFCSIIQCSAVLRGSLLGMCVTNELRVVNLISIKVYFYYYYYESRKPTRHKGVETDGLPIYFRPL